MAVTSVHVDLTAVCGAPRRPVSQVSKMSAHSLRKENNYHDMKRCKTKFLFKHEDLSTFSCEMQPLKNLRPGFFRLYNQCCIKQNENKSYYLQRIFQ